MQEQINEKTVAISIKTARLTAEVLQKAVKKLLDARKHKTPKEYKGKLIWAAGVTGRKGYQSDCPVPVQSEKGS